MAQLERLRLCHVSFSSGQKNYKLCFTVTVNAEEMRKALKDIEKAEKNGFNHCLAVFDLETYGANIGDCRLKYIDMSERAHPTDGRYNWGRGQDVTGRNKFKNGKLIPIKRKA